MFKTETLIPGLYNMAMMSQSIEQCRCHFGVTKYAGPFLKIEVGCNDDTCVFAVIFSIHTLPRSSLDVPQRSLPCLLNTAACGGLKPALGCRLWRHCWYKHTKRAYIKDVKQFAGFVGMSDLEDFRGVTHGHVISFRDCLQHQDLSAVSA